MVRKAVLRDDLGAGQGAGHDTETLWVNANRHGNDFTHIVDRAHAVGEKVDEQSATSFEDQRLTSIFEQGMGNIFEAFARHQYVPFTGPRVRRVVLGNRIGF
jgi:hypothetical protein